MATNYGDFILSLLQSYFPELELDEDSDMYAQIVQPILDRIGDDPLDTDLATFIPQRIKEEYPALKVDEAGAVLKSALINPTILIFDAFKRELQAIRAGKSLRDLSVLSDDEVDSLLANVFVERQGGERAVGTARVYFSTPFTIVADPSINFNASNGQLFVADGPQKLDSSDMALNVEGNLYYADIDVISLEENEDANIDAGELMTVTGLPAAVRVTNLAKFSGAVSRETTEALATRAEDLITERSLVTERGLRTTILTENAEIADVSVIGMAEDEMTRDILRGELRATADLGHGPVYAGGHDARFNKDSTFSIWGYGVEKFPLNNLIENLGPGTRDWHQRAIAVGDQITCEGFPYEVAEVVSTWEDATVRIPIEVLASSNDLAVGGTSRLAGVGPYWEGNLIGTAPSAFLPHAPLYITNTFYAGGAVESALSASINPDTDFLAIRDTTHVTGAMNFSRTKYWPISHVSGNNVVVYSNNEQFRLKELRIKAGCGPDVRNAGWWGVNGEGIDTADYPYGPATVYESTISGVNYIAVELTSPAAAVPGPTGGFLGVGGNVSPGDIITLFTVTKNLNSQEAVFWFEARIKWIGATGGLCLSVTSEWLTRHFPDVEFDTGGGDPYDVLGAFATWPNNYRWYWSIREGTGEGSIYPYSKYGWASSFLPAYDVPPNYTMDTGAGGYSTAYRPPGERSPEHRTPNLHAATFAPYQPWGDLDAALKTDGWTYVDKTEWAIVRFPQEKLPAWDSTEWTQPTAEPTAHDQYPFGTVGIEEPFAVEAIKEDSGTLTTYVGGVLTDAAKAWTPSAYIGYWVYIPSAVGTKWTAVTANAASTLTTSPTLAGVVPTDAYYLTRYRYVYYPVRFYGANYMFGLPDDGDPDKSAVVAGATTSYSHAGAVVTDTPNAWTVDEYVGAEVYFSGLGAWSTITANTADTFTISPAQGGLLVGGGDAYAIYNTPFTTSDEDKDWALRQDITSVENGLSISLSQIPEITAPIEVPANEFHVGGMADVYGKPVDAPEESSMSLYPVLSFDTGDVVLPASYSGSPATAGTTGIYGTDDGKFASADLLTYTHQLGDLLVILGPTTSPYYLHSYAVVGKPANQEIRVYPPFNQTAAIANHSYVILRTVNVSLSPVKLYRVRGGLDLVTSPGATTVSSPTRDFVAAGVQTGDTLAILEGRDQGTYTIVTVQNSYVELSVACVGNESELEFEIYANQGSLSLPVTKISKMLLGSGRSRSGYSLPYGNPAGALITAPAMAGNALAAPNSSNSATAGSLDIAVPYRFTDSSIDFTDAGVVTGQVLYIKTGTHVGTYTVVAVQSETIAPGVTQDMHLKVKGLTITESESDLEYEVGAAAQGSARCYFFDQMRVLLDSGTLFMNEEETRSYIPDPDTDAAVFEELTSSTDLVAFYDAVAGAVYLRSESVDFGTKELKANSAADMGYSGDSDLVYFLHQPIISTSTITPGTLALANRVLELVINGTTLSYTFSQNLEVEDVLAIVNKAFPAVELVWDAADTKYYLFSTSDIAIGTGDANDILLLADNATNLVSGAHVGPHRIAQNGITVWDTVGDIQDYPPLSATTVGQVQLLKYDSDTDVVPDWSAALSASMVRLHVRITRPGAQLFEAEDLTALGSYYYTDVDIAAKYPGPDFRLTTETAMAVTGAKPNGFTYVGDTDTSYSVLEDIQVTLPTYYFDEVPVPILGGNLDIEYRHVPSIQTMHSFITSKYYRTVCANILGLVSLPCEVYMEVVYSGSKTTAQAEEEVRDYLENFASGNDFSMRAFSSAMKSRGVLITTTPTMLVMEPDKQRRYWLNNVTESYTLPEYAAFLAIDLVVRKGY